jgi:hypothetical protein
MFPDDCSYLENNPKKSGLVSDPLFFKDYGFNKSRKLISCKGNGCSTIPENSSAN